MMQHMISQNIVKEFMELVRIPSPTRGERQMADTLKKKLEEIGCEVYEDDAGKKIGGNSGNVIGILHGTVGTPLLLAAHMDRVPNGDNINPQIKDERIVTDGTSILAADDLSGVVSILDGLRRIKASGKPHGDVEVVFSVCEEKLAQGGKNLDYSRVMAKHAYCLDSPGRIGRIICAAPSKVQFFVKIKGRKAHAGNCPEQGCNALIAAARALCDIRDGRIDEETTANWVLAKGGDVTNVVCDCVEIGGEARSRNADKLAAYVDYACAHITEATKAFGAAAEIEVKHCFDGFSVSSEEDVLRILSEVLTEMDIPVRAEGGGGGMDANHFNAHGIRTVGVATGYFKNHSSDEELYICDLVRSGEMVEKLILAYAGKSC